MDKYRKAIIFRFIPAYALYILALLVWTRPVFFDGHQYHTFRYSTDLNKLFVLFIIYVSSNIFFDYNSLRTTFSHFMLAQTTKRYAYHFTRNLLAVFGLFVPSQIVSCILWIYKREDPAFPVLHGNLFHQFLENHHLAVRLRNGPRRNSDCVQPVSGVNC